MDVKNVTAGEENSKNLPAMPADTPGVNNYLRDLLGQMHEIDAEREQEGVEFPDPGEGWTLERMTEAEQDAYADMADSVIAARQAEREERHDDARQHLRAFSRAFLRWMKAGVERLNRVQEEKDNG